MKDQIQQHLAGITRYMEKKGCMLNPYPNIVLRNDLAEASNVLAKTAYYEPASKTIVLYTAGRHPKDVLRSFAHEMIHHDQNMRGLASAAGEASDPNYAQNSKELRNLEKDAYLRGNMMFRDYCDTL